MWKTILVPHDFSASADTAASLARDLAKLHGARLVLVHVAEMPAMLGPSAAVVPDDGGAPIGMRDYALRQSNAHLERLAADLGADGTPTTFSATLPMTRWARPVRPWVPITIRSARSRSATATIS